MSRMDGIERPGAGPSWDTLVAHVDLSSSFSLIPVTLEGPAAATALLGALRAHYGTVVDLSPRSPEELRNLTTTVLSAEVPASASAVWIAGAVGDLNKKEPEWRLAWRAALAGLNQHRNEIQARFICPVILAGNSWLPPLFRDTAPDLWSVATAVIPVELVAPEPAVGLGILDLAEIDMAAGATLDPDYALSHAKELEGRPGHELVRARLLVRAADALLMSSDLEKAIACYRDALEVITRQAMPVEWAQTTTNLGNAYSDRIRGERAENLEEAIACYRGALEVMTRQAMPVDWAQTTMNLGIAYSDRIRGQRAENLREAIACYRDALEVITPESWPEVHVELQQALAEASLDLLSIADTPPISGSDE